MDQSIKDLKLEKVNSAKQGDDKLKIDFSIEEMNYFILLQNATPISIWHYPGKTCELCGGYRIGSHCRFLYPNCKVTKFF